MVEVRALALRDGRPVRVVWRVCIVNKLGSEAPVSHRCRAGYASGDAVFKVWAGARTAVPSSRCGLGRERRCRLQGVGWGANGGGLQVTVGLSKKGRVGIPRRSVRPGYVGGVIWRFAWGSAGVGRLVGRGRFAALCRRFGASGAVPVRPGGAVPWGSGGSGGLAGVSGEECG